MDKKLFIGYIMASAALFLFSYTQVDLSLTLSRLSIYQTIEKSFQYVGFYQRPLATGIFLLLVSVFFVLYLFALKAKQLLIWRIIIPMTVILVFSYPAFSHDIFNYMFDAKTVLVYHKIPYLVTPLEFTGVEPWLSFMHWTHIPSTFMPFWILLSLPAYLLGFGYFLGILWSFKALMAVSYLTTAWFIWKILSKLDPKHALMGVTVFALNPLVIFETLVSAHYDMVMMAFAMLSFYLYLRKKRLASFVALACSAATKIMTVTLVPLFVIGWQRKWSLVCTLVGFIFFIMITKREILPWYLIWFIPWVALLPRERWLRVISTSISAGFLLTYAPFLYYGDYQPPVTTIKLWTNIAFVALPIIWFLVSVVQSKQKKLEFDR